MHTIWSGFVNFSTERNCRCYNNNEWILTQHRYTFKAPLLSRTYENPYYPTALGLYFNYGAWYGRHFDEPEYGLAGDALAD